MKKIALTIGTVATVVAPVATVVSCSVFDDDSTKEQGFVSQKRLTVSSFDKSTGISTFQDEIRSNNRFLPKMAEDIQNEETRQYRLNITFNDGILKFIMNINHSGQGIVTVQDSTWDPNNGFKTQFSKVSGYLGIQNYATRFISALMKMPKGKTADEASSWVLNYMSTN